MASTDAQYTTQTEDCREVWQDKVICFVGGTDNHLLLLDLRPKVSYCSQQVQAQGSLYIQAGRELDTGGGLNIKGMWW